MTAIFGALALTYLAGALAFAGTTIAAGARNAGRTDFTPTMLVR